MALRIAVRRAFTGLRGASVRPWNKIPAGQTITLSPRCRAPCCTAATQQLLLDAVDAELKLERKVLDELPAMSGFDSTITGSLATLTRTFGDSVGQRVKVYIQRHVPPKQGDFRLVKTVKVEMDANHSIEVTSEDGLASEGEEEEQEDDIEPLFVPAFTVTVTKPTGDSVQLECSFEEYGPYLEQGRAWESMKVDSLSVVPAGTKEPQAVYAADTRNLSESLYMQLLEYLKDHGINEQFADSVIEFYKTFEHTCYCSDFLEELRKFLSQK